MPDLPRPALQLVEPEGTPPTEAERWSQEHPVGTPMIYYPVIGSHGEAVTVRSAAWALLHGAIVVKVAGRPGAVSVAHLEEAGLS